MTWLDGVLAAFDTETTGVDVEADRIVTAAIIERPGEDRNWLADPGVDIPAEATAVHGVTTAVAKGMGRPAGEVVGELSGALGKLLADGVPLVVYNAVYDLTLLDRETRRYGLEPFGEILSRGGLVIDPLVLDKHLDPYRRGKRNLGAVCGVYGVQLGGDAHSAEADALAAMRVAWRLGALHPRLRHMEPAKLMDLQACAKAAQSASLQEYFRSRGSDEVVDPSWPLKPYPGAAREL